MTPAKETYANLSTDIKGGAVLEVMAAVAHVLSFLVLTARTLMGVGTVMTSKNGLM